MKETLVDVSDMRLSDDGEEVLVAPSLGSCIAVTLYDEGVKAGGVMIFMLPCADEMAFKQAAEFPYMFGDTGIPAFFEAALAFGLDKSRLKVVVVGGGQMMGQVGYDNLGGRNVQIVQKAIKNLGLCASHQSVGGRVNRTLKLEIGSGHAYIKVAGQGTAKV
jgi:chemotaxis protein CheD